MRSIEHRIFEAGMPVAALMEKVAGKLSDRIADLYPRCRVGVLVGSGHNGGDALVVARELHFRGYEVRVYSPFSRFKELTEAHLQYAKSLGILYEIEDLRSCDLILDGLFGFGLTRSLEDPILSLIHQVNEWQIPIISIDLPSGLHTDTGRSLGTAIRATHTLCLGLWKLGLLQESALEFVGKAELIDFDIPLTDITAILGETPQLQRVTSAWAMSALPLNRPASTHKYKMGHLLLICGSNRYAGGALLTGLGGRSSGVGMLSIAAPNSLKPMLSSHLPEALILGCPETASGAIASLNCDFSAFDAIACGPGLTLDAADIVQQVLECDRPLVLDADGLNALAKLGAETLKNRQAPTILTPHLGEFKRLFPDTNLECRASAVRAAAAATGAIVLLKGARIAIADAQGQISINPESTPALARGGSGDVLTGLLGGLLAQNPTALLEITQTAAWWHAQAGILAAQTRSELGVDAHTLTQFLIPAIVAHQKN
ncbi:MAG: NAD(P)H-hydrate dehydratase [Leptolyngbya sp. Prado105]|jgi:NAD(P)H-hydrate epimerase|nr:NAD(P)H-hydrate dehydratase [Leptolyngbya sp. Prado105]